MAKRVAIIGGGASGLTAIKCCLDEGMIPVCYERTQHIGGLWRYTEHSVEGQGCINKSTVINTSKEMMCYSDYPIPKEYPVYMHNTFVYKYLVDYAEEFGMNKYITFNTEILSVTQDEDFAKTGKWKIKIKDHGTEGTPIEGDGVREEVFDGVLVCTGHHADVHKPKFEGLDDFQSRVVHTHDFKNPNDYVDKRVVIIGIGNSGGDAAVELARIAQVYLSTRKGSWVMNRIGPGGMPADFHFINRLAWSGPLWLRSMVSERNLSNRFDHAAYGLKPNHGVFSQHVMVNDELPNKIANGSVIVKPNVRRFTKSGVEFDDGTFEDNIDLVILATGYIFGFPFLDKSILEVKHNQVNAFKCMYPPDLDKHTLAIIGFVQPLGAIMPISEMQCRVATRVIKGVLDLPSRGEMWEDIRSKQIEMSQRYVTSQRHTIQVDYLTIMDELALLMGCKPDIKKLLLTDPKLAMKCFLGPCTPYQYRLHGPGAWSGAKQAIHTQLDRTMFPLKTRKVPASGSSSVEFYVKVVVVLIILYLFMKWF